MEYLNPSHWKRPVGFSNGVAAEGRMIFVAGQIGWDETSTFRTDDFVGQCEQALLNIVEVLKAGGAGPEHITRMTWYVTDKTEYMAKQKEIGAAYRAIIGRHFPAMTMVEVSGLVEDAALVEIEATAVLP